MSAERFESAGKIQIQIVEKMCENPCKQCAELCAANSQLKAELIASQKYAQECEDEAVDLRRQLCSALKDLAKLRTNSKSAEAIPKANMRGDLQCTSPSNVKKLDSMAACELKKPVPSRREGLRSAKYESTKRNSRAELSGDESRYTSSPLKRKAEIQVEHHVDPSNSASKRPKTDEDQTEKDFTFDEALDCLKDLSASWKDRVTAIQRIGEICNGPNVDALISSALFEKVFAVFSVQVSRSPMELIRGSMI